VLAEGFDGVLHFAAKSLVGESMGRPDCTTATTCAGRRADLRTDYRVGTSVVRAKREKTTAPTTAQLRAE